MRSPTPSRAQLEQTARNHLRLAYATGCDDDAAVDYATRMMGEAHRPLIGRVLAVHFKDYPL